MTLPSRKRTGMLADLFPGDPPFYLRNNSSSGSPPDCNNSNNALSLPYRPNLAGFVSNGSCSEEYRSVIDDLTIQNKKLKRRLRRYERMHDSQLQNDKLFEVRIHGLSDSKKRELEETLRQFALSLNHSPSQKQSSRDHLSTSQSMSTSIAPVATKPTSMTSTRVADSGYGSMSNSKTTSNQASATNTSSHRGLPNSGPTHTRQQRDNNIRHYLHDIPEGLLPRPPHVMTEKAKKKLIVRRLEQIFGGRGAQLDNSQQTQQQQEVSQSAARADRSELESRGQTAPAEGIREAQIMADDADDAMDVSTDQPRGSTAPRAPDRVEASDFADLDTPRPFESSYPEQRPTRPLDLDLERAQVPSDNVSYFRHLGFKLPDNFKGSPIDDQGWIYLNLLTNMAQLHTISVTPEFVKTALMEYSDKFELSPDGRKIRWRGGTGMTSSHSSATGASISQSPLYAAHERPRTGIKRTRSSGSMLQQPDAKKPALQQPRENKFIYTPLFPRHDEDEDASMADDESMTSPRGNELTGESSGLTSTGRRIATGKRHDNGPMVFYNNVPFCTDLSGDRTKPADSAWSASQYLYTDQPLGLPSAPVSGASHRHFPISMRGSQADASAKHAERYFDDSGLRKGNATPEPFRFDDGSAALKAPDFALPLRSPKHVAFADGLKESDFEASGLGGCTPADHFSLTVARQIGPLRESELQHPLGCLPRSKVDGILRHKDKMCVPDIQILSTRQRNLEPSALPPASYAFLDDDNTDDEPDDDESDDEPDEPVTEVSPPHRVPIGPIGLSEPKPTDIGSMSSEVSSGSGQSASGADDDDDEDQSVDFLALARQVDPQAIRAREREYDAEMAERLAEEIPAGSSAATAGGGSGFNSPMDVDGAAVGKGPSEDADMASNEAEGSVGS